MEALPSIQNKLHSVLVGASCALLPATVFAQTGFNLNYLGGAQLNSSAEILSFHAATGSVLSTYSSQLDGHGIQIYSLGSNGALSASRQVDLGAVLGGTTYSLTSVVADSQGRDFGVATLVPGTTEHCQGLSATGPKIGFPTYFFSFIK